MTFKVAIRKNDTGEIRFYAGEHDWFAYDKEDGQRWYWTEGNNGCDCNRRLCFVRAGGQEPDDSDWEVGCSDGKYSALYAELPDGRRIELDGTDI